MMNSWLQRLARTLFPQLKAQDERLRATQQLIEGSRRTRHQSGRVSRLVRSYLHMDRSLRRAQR